MGNFFESSLDEVTRLILVRHGRTNNNIEGRFGTRDDKPLDEVGRDQAIRVSSRLSEFEISQIYSSPLSRAKETAEIIAAKTSISIETHTGLIEYDNGIIAGLSIEEVKLRFPDIYKDVQNWTKSGPNQARNRFMAPGMESMENFRDRIFKFQNMILIKHPGEIVLAVTHLAVIKGFMTLLSGGSFNAPMNYLADNTSVTVIDYFYSSPVLRLFNDIRHLDIQLKYGKVTAF